MPITEKKHKSSISQEDGDTNIVTDRYVWKRNKIFTHEAIVERNIKLRQK